MCFTELDGVCCMTFNAILYQILLQKQEQRQSILELVLRSESVSINSSFHSLSVFCISCSEFTLGRQN